MGLFRKLFYMGPSKQEISAANERLKALIRPHARALATRKAQLIRKDAYGNVDTLKWDQEIKYFISHNLKPAILPDGTLDTIWMGDREVPVSTNFEYMYHPRSKLYRYIEQAIRVHEREQTRSVKSRDASVHELSPSEYEAYCAQQLEQYGWSTRLTKASGDQGADIIIERNEIKVVVQCKKYSRPVGNKAVQEVIAARAFEDAVFAVVVTNNRFTNAAEELATKSGVLLLHHSMLDSLWSQLSPSVHP